MVHKKSEYELQYQSLPNHIRAHIWKENFDFRESQKRLNLSDHYWRYQLIEDSCDCENGNEEEDVVKRYSYPKKLEETQKPLFLYQDKAVQTLDWNETIGTQSPIEENDVDVSLRKKIFPVAEEINRSVPSVAKANISEQDTAALNGSSLFNQRTFNEPRNETKGTPQLNLIHDNKKTTHVQMPSKNAVRWSHFGLSPSRNALNHFRSKCNFDPVFAAFGCNESNTDVGSHKTYNVRAPANQVHKTALMASGKRLKDIESHVAELKKKQLQRSHLSIGHVNSSSIWMTEYQDCFSRGQREPLSRRALQRPVVWRYS